MFQQSGVKQIVEEGERDLVKRKPQLYNVKVDQMKWPVVYHQDYNISFLGMEKLHPFDAGKWGRVYQFLIDDKLFESSDTVSPNEVTEDDLLLVHTRDYLNSLKWSASVARITEVPPVALLPNFIVQRKVLRPFRLQTGGSVLAGQLAIKHGWSINIGGGFHHCSGNRGGGFCAYADISLLIKFVFDHFEEVRRVMIIDLDAHQGNGHARDFMNNKDVYILDIYNRDIYPHDGFAKTGINRKVELRCGVNDTHYLPLVEKHVNEALLEFQPQLVVYNAGTDILAGDPLGALLISAAGIIERDRLVFSACRGRGVPIAMLTSGGYQRSTARIIADSLIQLHNNDLIGDILKPSTS